MLESANILTPTEMNDISSEEVTKFWGREMTDLAPKQKMLVIRLWQQLKQRRQSRPEDCAL
jgi:hypothetical protein